MGKLKKYLSNVWVATWAVLQTLDKLVNALCGGDPQEYISSRLGKREDGNERFWAKVVNLLFFWQKDHCGSQVQPNEGSDSVL